MEEPASRAPGDLTRSGGRGNRRLRRPPSGTDVRVVEQSPSAPSRPSGWPTRAPLLVTLVSLALFATGVGSRPDGAAWDVGYDLVLYNLVCLGAAGVCVQGARRSPTERLAWWAMTVALLVNVVGNLVYSLVIAPMDPEPYPSVADVFYLACYLPLYVALVGLTRTRVRRRSSGTPSRWRTTWA